MKQVANTLAKVQENGAQHAGAGKGNERGNDATNGAGGAGEGMQLE